MLVRTYILHFTYGHFLFPTDYRASLGLSKTFDSVDVAQLILNIMKTTLTNDIQRWSERTKYRKDKMEVPPGGAYRPFIGGSPSQTHS